MAELLSMEALDALIAAGQGSVPRAPVPTATPEEIEAELRAKEQDKIENALARSRREMSFTAEEMRRISVFANRTPGRRRSQISIMPSEQKQLSLEAQEKAKARNKPVRPGIYERHGRSGTYYKVSIGRVTFPERFPSLEAAQKARDSHNITSEKS